MPGSGAPKAGQVIEHYFLWSDEHATGLVEGRKPRPCLIVAVEEHPGSDSPRVTVLPITSQKPRSDNIPIPVPPNILARLGLDPTLASWVVVEEANVFAWPGFNLVPRGDGGFVLGVVTAGFFERVRAAVIAVRSGDRMRKIERD